MIAKQHCDMTMKILPGIYLVCVMMGSPAFGQQPDCLKLALEIRADTTKSIWDYRNINPKTCYCLGQIFAQWDLDKKIYRLQSFGFPDFNDPCTVCIYKKYGFEFAYQGDVITEPMTRYMEGYNEVVNGYLKSKIGDSAFLHLDDTPETYFNPRDFINKNFGDHRRGNLFITEIITDTVINVKLITDSLFRDYPQYGEKVSYLLTDFVYKTIIDSNEQGTRLNYREFKEIGFRLTKKKNNHYFMKIEFDFSNLVNDEPYCWCALSDPEEYSYIQPFCIKN